MTSLKALLKEFDEKFTSQDDRVYTGTLTAGKIRKFITKVYHQGELNEQEEHKKQVEVAYHVKVQNL